MKNGPEGWRPVVVILFERRRDPEPGPLVAPGDYRVRLQAGAQEYTTPLRILPDPHSAGTTATLQQQVAFALEVHGEISDVARLLNSIEWDKKQLADLEAMLGEHASKYVTVIEGAKDLYGKLLALESKLVDVHLTGAREDSIATRSSSTAGS